MKLFFLCSFALLIINNIANAQMPTLDLAAKKSVKINCEDSIPVLAGEIVTCETVCKIKIVETYHNEESCDQTCWPESQLTRSELTVTRFPQNQIIFNHLEIAKGISNTTMAEANKIAGQVCTKIEITRSIQ
ncbi:MAG: hypothetical protein Q7U04_00155 [Bacteriovorax sp.]|nr:hypothetical protein [Bacteriovorax sp.]